MGQGGSCPPLFEKGGIAGADPDFEVGGSWEWP